MQSEDGVSLANQSERIAAWAKANGLEVSEVFTDAGISGKRADNRPALQQALDAVSKSKGILVVYSLSRMSRSVKDAITISERLDKAGADLVSLSERLDTSTASGKMTFRMMAVLAEFERDQLSERVASAMGHLKAQNKRVGKIPFGWDLLTDGETLEANQDEQKVIGKIMELHGQGLSLRAIAKTLNDQGVAAKTGNHWHPETVRGLVKRNSMEVAA
jgi:DNA invertase Pin-like site-specific DNA recombinase